MLLFRQSRGADASAKDAKELSCACKMIPTKIKWAWVANPQPKVFHTPHVVSAHLVHNDLGFKQPALAFLENYRIQENRNKNLIPFHR